MKFGKLAVGALLIGVSFGAFQAASAAALYDNGVEGQYINGSAINYDNQPPPYVGPIISDSFDLSSQSTVNGVDFGYLLYAPGGPIDTVQWSITADPNGGTLYGSGTATPSSTFLVDDQFSHNIYQGDFSIPGLALSAGTYYLNLWNATLPATEYEFVYWEDGSGASEAYDSQIGALDPSNGLANCDDPTSAGYCSQSFQILGNVGASVPEPGSIALFGAGLLALGAALRGRRAGKRTC